MCKKCNLCGTLGPGLMGCNTGILILKRRFRGHRRWQITIVFPFLGTWLSWLYAAEDLAPFGVDPVFKSGTNMYNPDLDNQVSVTQYYNCSDLSFNPTYNIQDTATTVSILLIQLDDPILMQVSKTLIAGSRFRTVIVTSSRVWPKNSFWTLGNDLLWSHS